MLLVFMALCSGYVLREEVAADRGFDTWDGGVCVFHGILPPNPQESCHPIHGKAATDSTGKLPLIPWESCH
jgi:hypothetical protein